MLFGWGLASNLNRLGVDDSIIQGILRHSTVSVTQNHYIKTARPDTIAAMRKLSDALLCSPCAPTEAAKTHKWCINMTKQMRLNPSE
jgi:hypothetical protein